MPLYGGQGTDEYRDIFHQVLVPAAAAFRPEFVLISAGFDAHRDDPLASMGITDEGLRRTHSYCGSIAQTHCEGRIVACLEGGYDLRALAASVEHHILALMET